MQQGLLSPIFLQAHFLPVDTRLARDGLVLALSIQEFLTKKLPIFQKQFIELISLIDDVERQTNIF